MMSAATIKQQPLPVAETARLAVSIRDLDIRFGDKGNEFTALSKVSVDIPEGSFVTMLGPSGCGKSTLLRCIADLVDISDGSVSVFGRPPR